MSRSASRRLRGGAVLGATALGLAAIALAAGPVRAAGAATFGPRPGVLAGTHPSWATAATDSGITPAATRVAAQVYLASRAPAALAAYARAVSAPGSARYHRYLTPAQQQARFGPSAAAAGRVRAWLRHAGLRVTASTEQYISVAGPAAAVRRAFGTRLRNYTLSGHLYHAPARNAVVPAALAPAVLGVSGLNNAAGPGAPDGGPGGGPGPRDHRTAPAAAGAAAAPAARPQQGRPPYVGLSPCSAYWGQRTPAGLPPAYGHASPLPVCGYAPRQLRGAYGVPGTGLTGRGATVAVVDAYGSATIAGDVNSFARFNGIPQFAPGQFRQVVTPGAVEQPGRLRRAGRLEAGGVTRHRGRAHHGPGRPGHLCRR